MNIVIHMTECKPQSTIASARVARFIADTLDYNLVDTRVRIRDLISYDPLIERLVIVNGPMAFCDFLEELASLVRLAEEVVWVQQDYTIMPPSADSKAESPFRKVFADLKLRPTFWTTCKDNVKTADDRYINWNQLTWDPKPFSKPTKGKILYYGAFREKRLTSFKRFFNGMCPIDISTTTLRAKKFNALYPGMCVPVFKNVIDEAGAYLASLYIEDDKSHTHFHSPANRFYEMLSAGVPMFFDQECTGMLAMSGIMVPADWQVKNGQDLLQKYTQTNLIEMRQRQRDLWHKDYIGDLTKTLKEIA